MPAETVDLENDIGTFLNERCKDELALIGEIYPEKQSVEVNFQELSEFSPYLSERLLSNPDEVIKEFHKAIEKEKAHIAFASKVDDEPRIYVRFSNLPPEREIMVRDCISKYLNKFFTMQGLVTMATEVKPKVWKGVFRCKRCQAVTELVQDKKKLKDPAVCEHCGRKEFEMDEELSHYIDFQRLQVQEPLEIIKGGDQAKRIAVWLEEDLIKKEVVPGQRIIITGTLRLAPQKPGKQKDIVYQKFVEANNIEFTEPGFDELEITEGEVVEIKKLANDPKIYDKMVGSIAPSIYGHNEAKEAVALQLCGGASGKELNDTTKIRDSIHILMIGDPGTAKSQILKFVNNLAPKSLYVSGKSASGGGLTAIAEKDEFGEGGWVLKAGALVLASGGLACIDEFDKMSDEDRSAIHEALEQQTVSVAKAGIIATFKASSAVLAAANPKYSRYDPYKTPAEQFDIPASLLSRFDLIFPIKDVLDETKDKNIADHILGAHKYAQTMAANSDDLDEEMGKKLEPAIPLKILKKYFAYARKNCHPILDERAVTKIGDYYVDLRKRSGGGSVPLTPRQLEGLVRLAEASAKIRLSNNVTIEDAERAIRLVEFVLRELGMEGEDGNFDIDRIVSEHPQSDRDKIHTITLIIKGLEEEYDMVPKTRVLEDAKTLHNIDKYTANKLIDELVRKGDLYEPRHDNLKTVRQ